VCGKMSGKRKKSVEELEAELKHAREEIKRLKEEAAAHV